jgi:hypothetical protein
MSGPDLGYCDPWNQLLLVRSPMKPTIRVTLLRDDEKAWKIRVAIYSRVASIIVAAIQHSDNTKRSPG